MTAKAGGKWGDLAPRIVTSVALVAIGGSAIYLGGLWFVAAVSLVVGAIAWELSVMAQSRFSLIVAVAAGLCCAGAALLPPGWGLPLVIVPALISQRAIGRARVPHALFMLIVLLAGYGLIGLRGDTDPGWMLWLVGLVAATDIAGYFAGRLIGGPKFWPRISPKKTWSGTVAGWISAAVLGAVMIAIGGLGPEIIVISVAVSIASQLGDVAESAFKRNVGVKDSSNLLPGHGGFFDRFDGVLGAAVFVLLIQQFISFPPGLT